MMKPMTRRSRTRASFSIFRARDDSVYLDFEADAALGEVGGAHAPAVEFGPEPHDVEPQAQVRAVARLAGPLAVAQRHHRIEEARGHRPGKGQGRRSGRRPAPPPPPLPAPAP